MTYDDFRALCERRRSIRYFADKPISQEEVLKLVELARLAPSVENLQPWHFHIIFNRDLRHKLMKASCYGNFVEGAGVFIVVTTKRDLEHAAAEPVWNTRELECSCMAAMTNILHGATAMGLGSCWVSLHRGEALEILNLPDEETVVGGLMIGHYRMGEEEPGSGHRRKPLKEMVTIHEDMNVPGLLKK